VNREKTSSKREWRKKKIMKINKGRCNVRTKEEKKIRLEAEVVKRTAYNKIE
jgi:hypothetical protein